jgi:hypothetical protein
MMAIEVDRRRFLRYSGAASAVAGGAWAAPSVRGTSTAFAAGSCQHNGALTWSSVTGGTHEPNKNGTTTFTVQVPGTGGGPTAHVLVTVTAVGAPGTGNGNNGGVDKEAPSTATTRTTSSA